jgi:hypothetical protein
MTMELKRPKRSYQPRLYKFLQNMMEVKNFRPYAVHLWRVMDGVAFEDTETALETTLLEYKAANDGKTAKPRAKKSTSG